MADKKYVYIQLYPKDLLADEKLAKCDKANAWGAYLALLNIFAQEPVRGCIRLSDWDTHPDNARKSLVANFERANTLRAKVSAFARVVAQRTPLKVSPVAEGIEQLVTFGVVVMHGDALIQPRMFREGRGHLEGYNPEPEQQEVVALQVTEKTTPSTNKKQEEKSIPAHALRANTRDSNSEREYEYKNKNKGNKGVQGDSDPVSENGENIPDDGFAAFWNLYDKRKTDNQIIDQRAVQSLWQSLTDDERRAAMDFLPRYVAATPTKRWRMSPYYFLRDKAWLTLEIDNGRVRNNRDESDDDKEQGTAAAPRRQAKGKAATAQRPVSEQPPTQEEVSAYWQERAEQGKPLLYISAEEFYATCETDGWTHGKDRKPIMNWKTFALGCDTYRRNHGDRPVGARPSAAAPPPRSGEPVKAEPNKDGQGKYRKW